MLRYPYEVRRDDAYFEDIPDTKLGRDAIDLAKHIVQTKLGYFEPGKFEDQYETALRELIAKKQAGERIEVPRERAPAKVINLMDALRRSVEGAETKKPPAPSHKQRTKKPARKPARKLKRAG